MEVEGINGEERGDVAEAGRNGMCLEWKECRGNRRRMDACSYFRRKKEWEQSVDWTRCRHVIVGRNWIVLNVKS